MWCQRCQQDVPAVAARGGASVVCARCQHEFTGLTSGHARDILDNGVSLDEASNRRESDPLESIADWQTDLKLRKMEKLLGRRAHAPVEGRRDMATHQRFDPPQDLYAQGPGFPDQSAGITPDTTGRSQSTPPAVARQRSSLGGQLLSWLIVIAGMFIFSGGVGLGVRSIALDIPLYREASIILALFGQGLLVIGLVLVVSRLWRNSRYSTNKLQEVHRQLGEVHRTTETILGQRGGSAPAFYADLARGASPQMLLASLKGQLDQLAVRVGSDH